MKPADARSCAHRSRWTRTRRTCSLLKGVSCFEMDARSIRRSLTVTLGLLATMLPTSAHVVVKELPPPTAGETAWTYLWLGYEHILPLGFDHILFVISLFLLSPKLKPIIIQATTFTVAH